MICEYCKKDHNGLYGSGRFCNKSCANKFSSNKKTKDTYIQIGNKLKGKSCNNKGHKFSRPSRTDRDDRINKRRGSF